MFLIFNLDFVICGGANLREFYHRRLRKKILVSLGEDSIGVIRYKDTPYLAQLHADAIRRTANSRYVP